MREYRARSQHAGAQIEQERGRDHGSVAEVVECIAHQDRPGTSAGFLRVVAVRVPMLVAFVMVRVVDQRELFEDEKTDDSAG